MDNEYILTSDGELYHYGVPGMKWGVIRWRQASANRGIARREHKNEKLERKAAKYDVKAAKRAYKNVKKGFEESGLVATKKSAKLNVKSAKLEKKALNMEAGSRKQLRTKRKAAKAKLKSLEAMDVSELATKKDYKYKIGAAKARYKIEKNNMKIDSLNTRSIELGRRLMEADTKD